MDEDRSKYSKLILDSKSERKLIVAGPGTGKTFTFKGVLKTKEERGLVLTFIRNLVSDLESELGEYADVYTFHGFCRRVMHQHPPEGLTKHFTYYPCLPILIAEDISRIRSLTETKEIDSDFMNLRAGSPLVELALQICFRNIQKLYLNIANL
jgi:superfamily I DNA/RNA helicase